MGKGRLKEYTISNKHPVSDLAITEGLHNMESLLHFVEHLPYGRNANRTDLNLVIQEKKGTCSSKHAFIKKIAEENNWPDIELILGMYKMNATNTPKIGDSLSTNGFDYVPEAHCYIRFENERIDITSPEASFSKIENDILFEHPIAAHQVAEDKVQIHQDYLRKWIEENNIAKSFEEVWAIRELCIQRLSV